MTRVLLITDTERVLRVFESLEKNGALQLKTAATLAGAGTALAAGAPDFTFVQSRISGFSGDILLRHLNKTLPEGAKIVLLAGNPEDGAQAKLQGRPYLDLTIGDEALADEITRTLAGRRRSPSKKGATSRAAPVAATPEAQVADVPIVPPRVTEEKKRKEEPAEEEPAADSVARKPVKVVARELPADPPVRPPAKPGAESFDAVMRRTAAKGELSLHGQLEVEDQVTVRQPACASSEATEGVTRFLQEEAPGPVQPDGFFHGESLADAMLRAEQKKSRHWVWMLPLGLALLCIPLFYYLASKKPATAPVQSPAQAPEQAPASAPAVPPAAKAEVKAKAESGKPAVKPTEPVAKPAAKAGLKTLPSFVSGARLDAAYGKTHPGWQRYLGAQTEYKVFKEADRYRAIQVIALGGASISEQQFKRVLLEFGGGDSYQVKSAAQKADYLVEQAVAKGGIAVTIYKKKSDPKIKAVVLYYP